MLFASFENNIWISADHGLTWSLRPIENNLRVNRIFSDGSYLLAMTTAGVYKSINNGMNWKKSNTGFERVAFSGIRSNKKESFIGIARGGIIHSTDGGESWTRFDGGLGNGNTYLHAVSNTSAFASSFKSYAYSGVTESMSSQVYKLNGISQWSALDSWPLDMIYSMTISESGKYAMLGSVKGTYQFGIQLSKDGGNSWNQVFLGITNNGLEEDEASTLLYDRDTLYAGTDYSGIYKTWDDGAHWTSITSSANGWNLPHTYEDLGINEKVVEVSQIRKNKNHLYVLASLVSSDQTLFHSSDWGKTWEQIDISGLFPGRPVYAQSMTVLDNGKVFLSAWALNSNDSYNHAGIFESVDHGATWKLYGGDFPDQYPIQIESAGKYVYVYTPNRLWRIPQSEERNALIYSSSVKQSANAEVVVPIRMNLFQDLVSAQFSVKWNPAVATYLGITSSGIKGLDATFGTTQTTKGQLTYSWTGNDGQSLSLPDSSILFFIRFRLSGMPGDSTSVKVVGNPLEILMNNKNMDSVYPDTRMGIIQIAELVTSIPKNEKQIMCFPVPYDRHVSIRFFSEKAEEVSITMLDAVGRTVESRNVSALTGDNTVDMDGNDLNPPGLYILDLRTMNGSTKIKVVKK